MARPKVSISVSNGNLGLTGPAEFGTSVILVASPAAPVAGYSVPFLVRNKKEVSTAFAQAGNEPVVNAINNGFYAEAAEGTKVYILAMAATTTLATLLAAANANKALNMGVGDVRLLAAIKFPGGSYTPTITDGLDDDVVAAVTAAQTLANAWFATKKPFRFLIEGFAFADATDAKDYSAEANRNGGIVIGNIDGSTALATLLALGRASKSHPQQNIGRIKTGSLAIAENAVVKIGAITVEQMADADLETLWTKRYITFERNETGSGYVFNDDNTLTSLEDDYNNFRYGRVIDNATRIAYTSYYKELKEDVDVDEDGRLAAVVEKALETTIETDIDAAMRPQLSKKNDGTAAVECLVNPDPTQYAQLYIANNITDPNFNILQTNQVYLFIRLKPKGCLKYLDVYLGFTA